MAKIKIKVDRVRVLDESNELSDSDEPYVIVFVADRSNQTAGFSIPNAKTTMHSWTDADEGDLLHTLTKDEVPPALRDAFFLSFSEYCWGPNGEPAVVDHPDDLMILAGIMENDDGSPAAARQIVNGLMAGSLGNMIGAKLTRDEMVSRLKKDFEGALQAARVTGAPDFDDRVGPVLELRLTPSDLAKAQTKTVRRNLTFNGGDANGAYRVGFDIVPG